MDAPPPSALKCSAVVCTYNGVRYLDEQLESVLGQRRPPDEIVISDDASSDGTWDAVQRFAKRSAIPTVLRRSVTNFGFVRNFEEAIKMATGDLIFLCDQDDIWDPQKVGVFEGLFSTDPSVGMVFSDALLIDERGTPIGQRAWERSTVNFTDQQRRRWRSEPDSAVERLLMCNVVTGATMAFRSRYIPLVLPVARPAKSVIPHDLWIALLISAVAPTIPLETPYTRYRLHSQQALGLRTPDADLPRRHDAILLEILDHLTLALDRLRSHSSQFPPTPAGLAAIEGKIEHLETRLALKGSPMRRVPIVLGELRKGNYGKFSSGALSAISDLFPALRTVPLPRLPRRS